jgi:aprataxin
MTVTKLMSPKPKAPEVETKTSLGKIVKQSIKFSGRDGLAAYTADPASYPPDRVLYHTKDWVVINDLYPKSSVHVLLLPRDPTKQLLHPFDAFSDPAFLAAVQAEVTKLHSLVASELRRKYSSFSASDKARNAALDAEPPLTLEELPAGRDWGKEVMSGIHAHPSMNHLHIHILSVDRVSPCMRHRKHYNSFNTRFFVPVEDFPLAEDDERRHPGREGYLQRDMECWRCGRNFKNRFAELKEHLAQEFEEWKRL